MKTIFRRMRSYCKKDVKETTELYRLRSYCIEIHKWINNINPTYMNEIFKLKTTSRAVRCNYKLNLHVPTIN